MECNANNAELQALMVEYDLSEQSDMSEIEAACLKEMRAAGVGSDERRRSEAIAADIANMNRFAFGAGVSENGPARLALEDAPAPARPGGAAPGRPPVPPRPLAAAAARSPTAAAAQGRNSTCGLGGLSGLKGLRQRKRRFSSVTGRRARACEAITREKQQGCVRRGCRPLWSQLGQLGHFAHSNKSARRRKRP